MACWGNGITMETASLQTQKSLCLWPMRYTFISCDFQIFSSLIKSTMSTSRFPWVVWYWYTFRTWFLMSGETPDALRSIYNIQTKPSSQERIETIFLIYQIVDNVTPYKLCVYIYINKN